jgi:hypothetical protein
VTATTYSDRTADSALGRPAPRSARFLQCQRCGATGSVVDVSRFPRVGARFEHRVLRVVGYSGAFRREATRCGWAVVPSIAKTRR